jgi:hypothetical protein
MEMKSLSFGVKVSSTFVPQQSNKVKGHHRRLSHFQRHALKFITFFFLSRSRPEPAKQGIFPPKSGRTPRTLMGKRAHAL